MFLNSCPTFATRWVDSAASYPCRGDRLPAGVDGLPQCAGPMRCDLNVSGRWRDATPVGRLSRTRISGHSHDMPLRRGGVAYAVMYQGSTFRAFVAFGRLQTDCVAESGVGGRGRACTNKYLGTYPLRDYRARICWCKHTQATKRARTPV